MALNKIFGYLLILLGLIIILGTLYVSYQIFTGKAVVPQVFFVPSKEAVQAVKSKNLNYDPQKQMEELIKQQLAEIFPVDLLPRFLNLVSWSILAMVLIFGGSKIASLGIKLVF